MTAKITITFTDDLLKSLKKLGSAKLSLDAAPNGRAGPARAAGRAASGKPGPKSKTPGTYREGSHSAKLLAWAGGRKRPFGNADVMRKLKITRGHASMVLSKMVRDGAVKRAERGAYVAA